MLFAWLLWGDFCFSVMETAWPNVLPLMLKAEGAPNFLLSLTVTVLPSALNFVLNPIISTASDRYRGSLGRRMPFLLFATPFVVLFLILLGFSRQLGFTLHGLISVFFPAISPAMVTIATICFLVACFRFFELFISTVFWYLFNDVVPSEFMGRFIGLFRTVGSFAAALFSFFLLQYAETHTSLLFFSVALLYGCAFLLMGLNVREGEYPAPEKHRKSTPLAWIMIFFNECMSHRIYRRVYLFGALLGVSNAINLFMIFMALSIGLTLGEIGRISGVAAVISMVLMYPMGLLVDRFHPLRVMLVAQIIFCLATSFKFIFLFREFPKPMAFWIYAATSALVIPINVAIVAAGLPMVMRLFPREKFGQFCSANAMCTALGTIIGGSLAGSSLDLAKHFFFPTGDYFYRLVPVWNVFFSLLSLAAMILVFREWKRLGGDQGYQPPPTAKLDISPAIKFIQSLFQLKVTPPRKLQ